MKKRFLICDKAVLIVFSLSWVYYRPKRYCPILVTLEGSALWRNTLATVLLHDQNWIIPLGLVVLFLLFRAKKRFVS